MFKLIWTVVKLALFAGAILVLSHWVRWDGKSVSDQIETRLSQAERLPIVNKLKQEVAGAEKPGKTRAEPKDPHGVTPEEKRELRDLLRK